MKKEELKKRIESKLYFNGFQDAEVEIREVKTKNRSKLRSLVSAKPQVTVRYASKKPTIFKKLYQKVTGKPFIKKKTLM